jgi:hypothetical protein
MSMLLLPRLPALKLSVFDPYVLTLSDLVAAHCGHLSLAGSDIQAREKLMAGP